MMGVLEMSEGAERSLRDLELEGVALDLFRELRCLVCEGESLAASRAPFAVELRCAIRERLGGGETVNEVRAWLLESYGAEIFATPDLSLGSLALWLIPAVVVVLCVIFWRRVTSQNIN